MPFIISISYSLGKYVRKKRKMMIIIVYLIEIIK